MPEKKSKDEKKQPVAQRAANQYAANITGRGQIDTDPNRTLSGGELRKAGLAEVKSVRAKATEAAATKPTATQRFLKSKMDRMFDPNAEYKAEGGEKHKSKK